MAAPGSVSLTEELFQVTQLNQYRDSIQAIHPGDGISEKMFPTCIHGTKFELDNRLTYKVNKIRKMCQRHALVVTSVKLWTTIPPSFQKTDDEIRRLCDIHLLYVCKDTYSVLKPVFEWKCEVPIGEVSLVTSPEPK